MGDSALLPVYGAAALECALRIGRIGRLSEDQMKININRKLLFCGEFAIAFCLCAGFATVAQADEVHAPLFTLDCDGQYTTAEGQASCNGSTVSAAGSPYAVASSNSTGIGEDGSGSTSGSAELQYYVVVNGGTAGDLVPLDVEGSLSTSALGDTGYDVTNAEASLTLSFENGSIHASESVACGNVLRGGNCSDNQWSGTLHANAAVGYYNKVTLVASTNIAGAGSANAYADPHIYIDPAFANANPQYTLSLNVSNVLPQTGVPEPASWLLELGALGVLGGVWFRRRRTQMR